MMEPSSKSSSLRSPVVVEKVVVEVEDELTADGGGRPAVLLTASGGSSALCTVSLQKWSKQPSLMSTSSTCICPSCTPPSFSSLLSSSVFDSKLCRNRSRFFAS